MPKHFELHRSFLLLLFLVASTTLFAQAPKWQKKAHKAMLSIITYGADGQMLHTTNGFFIHPDGIVLSDYHSFQGAVRAAVFDASGNEWPVESIMGANSLYDVVKVKVSAKKAVSLTLASDDSQKGAKVFILPYSSNNSHAISSTITDVSTFNEHYSYYTLPIRVPEKWTSCPVMNETGDVIGLLQMAAMAKDTCSYAVSVLFADSLHTHALSAASSDYQAIPMKKALPGEATQAHSFIYLTGTRDTTLYLSYVEDYLTLFPTEANGYTMKAEMLADLRRYDEAEAVWAAGMKAASHPEDIYYSRANAIFRHVSMDKAPESWTLDTAMEEVEHARSINPLPVYSALKAQILYSQKEYAKACEQFLALNNTNLRSADNFLYAAQCQQMVNDTLAVLALQDSAVACFTKPYVEAAAPALLMRSGTLISLHRYREAVRDLNDYEHLKSKNLTANFYYRREQAEMRCRMFQQALSDIEQAVKMAPREPLFQAEAAAVHYRFGNLDDAIAAARQAIALDDEFADAHRILGVCLRAQQKETEARTALQRAADLGDEMAKSLLNAAP